LVIKQPIPYGGTKGVYIYKKTILPIYGSTSPIHLKLFFSNLTKNELQWD